MPATVTQQEPLRLNFMEGERQVVVLTEKEERFAITVDEAIAACRASTNIREFKRQFNQLLQKLGHWIGNHQKKIRFAFLTVRDQGLLFLVVRKETKYDREFEDELTELDVAVAHDTSFDLIHLSVLALPNVEREACTAFLNPALALEHSSTNA